MEDEELLYEKIYNVIQKLGLLQQNRITIAELQQENEKLKKELSALKISEEEWLDKNE